MQNQDTQHILVVYKARHETAFLLASKIVSFLRENGHTSTLLSAEDDDPAYDDATLVVVLGGDGTILGVARRLAGRKAPLLGINFGRVGFLADAQPDAWQEKITEFLSGLSAVRSTTALRWRVKRAGAAFAEGTAINEVVLSRGALSRLVCIAMIVNGQQMGTVCGDGVILSTPLGSTAYCVAAGGSLLYPGLEALQFTPICPFMHTIPSMVFPCDTAFVLRVLQGSTECYLTVDGQNGYHLQRDDVVEVNPLSDAFRFLCSKTAFIERLQSRWFATNTSECYY
ncbi:MAG: NAD+ kinase [Candidatus Desulfovibrio kirbyi]|jgi:NAD+ kinase|uniref:NAD kinase n=1 Tax=Candidatus Desulfovibrio kirbyi TaxID=2696086 RepID=A0A6L2R4G7_9BACT|nr:NAD(+)/NADH kinase [Desulfovibrio sp.]GFH62470.1 MAG: NAD+ kinase [Candidatus Desulfovibrio kirbyi]